jgi:hypothetical protein
LRRYTKALIHPIAPDGDDLEVAVLGAVAGRAFATC